MKRLTAAISVAALTLTGCAALAEQTVAEKGEERLAKMLEGRIAGEPEMCITVLRDDDLEVIDKTAIVYDAGPTIWVARPREPRMLNQFDVLVIERTGSQLCTTDVKRTIDPTTRVTTGVVFLENFVPYTKAEG